MEIISQLILNSIIAGAVYALIALGFNFIYWVTKFFNIAYGAMAAVGAYTVFFFFTSSGVNLYLSVFLGVLFAGAFGLLFDKILFLPLRKRNASNVVMLIASLGLFTIMQSVIAIFFSNRFHSLTDIFIAQKTFRLYGGVITDVQVVVIITVILILAGFHLMLNKTVFGKAVKATGDDSEVAEIVGINTDKIIGYVFFIGSAISGLSGILVGFDTGIMPSMGMDMLLKGVTASIIGGVGNVSGSVLGGLLLGFFENFVSWELPGQWKSSMSFVLLIIFLLFRPHGILKK